MKHAPLNITCPNRYDFPRHRKKLDKVIKRGMSVLDVGCSYGFETTRLAYNYPFSDFIGIDIDPKAIEIAKRGIWHTSLFMENFGLSLDAAWNPSFFPSIFSYGNKKRVVRKKNEYGDSVFHNRRTNKVIDMADYQQKWSIVRRNKYLTNLDFRVMDLDRMKFPKKSFDLILACNCVFKPLGQENEDFNNRYIRHFMNYLKTDGILYSSDFIKQK